MYTEQRASTGFSIHTATLRSTHSLTLHSSEIPWAASPVVPFVGQTHVGHTPEHRRKTMVTTWPTPASQSELNKSEEKTFREICVSNNQMRWSKNEIPSGILQRQAKCDPAASRCQAHLWTASELSLGPSAVRILKKQILWGPRYQQT